MNVLSRKRFSVNLTLYIDRGFFVRIGVILLIFAIAKISQEWSYIYQLLTKSVNKLSSGLDKAQRGFCTILIHKPSPEEIGSNQVRYDTKVKVRAQVKVKGMIKVRVRVIALGTHIRFPENLVKIRQAGVSE